MLVTANLNANSSTLTGSFSTVSKIPPDVTALKVAQEGRIKLLADNQEMEALVVLTPILLSCGIIAIPEALVVYFWRLKQSW